MRIRFFFFFFFKQKTAYEITYGDWSSDVCSSDLARNFQRDLAKYEESGAIILGVSVDTAQSHKDFCTKEGLNFKLLADPDAKVSTEYGSVMDYKGSKLAARNTFLINPKGEIAKVYTGVKPAGHSEQVLKDLAELKKS